MQTILITGATSGIGKACADHFQDMGAELVLVDQQTGDGIIKGDVSDPEFWKTLDLPALTGAVVNAGIGSFSFIGDTDFAEWRRVMAVNLDGAFLTLKAALAAMQRGGSIVVTASATGLKPVPMTAAYGTSKAAVIQLARIAAAENAKRGIRVNAIAPGGVDTNIWEPMLDPERDRAEQIAEMGADVPLGRYATAAEIAEQVAFLMSDAAGTMTGAVLTSDGGFTL
ncbi:SDR family NAD(P)-dependent oxidoreductase [Sphingomicrobium clamense]|uniref:SDR family oxidoreductase n=1 Tax=Sphingomicrobium clamense TaxID=2851013 RepID=A0ABS6V767_9SPHN|nr:SDR family oxidoreductase [Sphingomicrobium sp. B8]MBW0145316.1 SDR family oxidoreductase [Sphingomicrobium sp. B8]